MACDFGRSQNSGQLVESTCGPCTFGGLGTAVFRSNQHARIQIWFLSNGRDFIMVTHICTSAPDPKEVAEVQQIVPGLTLGAGDANAPSTLSPAPPKPLNKKPKWKFW
jgi:hypothetical protein